MKEASGARTRVTVYDSDPRSWKIGDGADYNLRHQGLFPLERGSSFTRSETGDRSSHRPKLARTFNDETWDVVDTDGIESWVSQDLLKTCTSVEPVSESDHCKVGMTAIVMGDVNAVHALECAHRRQLLAARALHER